jgi:hypothetical protein
MGVVSPQKNSPEKSSGECPPSHKYLETLSSWVEFYLPLNFLHLNGRELSLSAVEILQLSAANRILLVTEGVQLSKAERIPLGQ